MSNSRRHDVARATTPQPYTHRPRDVVRVAPTVVRAFEAGADGLEVLAFGRRDASDRGEIIDGWRDGNPESEADA